MITIQSVIEVLENLAPSSYQESYDNVGLLTGMPAEECTGILCTLDATEEVIVEAKKQGCNMIVAHHPIIFSGLKKINGKTYVERAVIAAIKNDVAIILDTINNNNDLVDEKNKIIINLENINTKLAKLINHESLAGQKIDSIYNELNFFEHNDNCPTCKQEIT